MNAEQPLSVVLHRVKETKNTVRYDTDGSDDRAPIDSLYLKKFALDGIRPEKIEVVINFDE